MIKMRKRGGFTIIELTLAMSFISILLLAIAMTAIQAGRIYNKGIVMQSVNQAGRDISDTLRRDFLQVRPGDGIAQVFTGDGETGRFCLGDYSYIWNNPKVLDDPDSVDADDMIRVDGQPINFVRVADKQSLCMEQGETGQRPMALPTGNSVTSLLKQQSDGDVVLAIHSFNITRLTSSENSQEALYRLEFTVGTSDESEINTANQSCRPPSDSESNEEFCAINQFDMIVRANG